MVLTFLGGEFLPAPRFPRAGNSTAVSMEMFVGELLDILRVRNPGKVPGVEIQRNTLAGRTELNA